MNSKRHEMWRIALLDGIRFSHPQYLLLLPVVLAYTWWVLRGSLADLDRARARIATGARVILMTLLILALAGLQWTHRSHTMCTVFALDVSDSVSPRQQAVALDYLKQAVRHMKPGDQCALVAFGADAFLDHAPEDRSAIQKVVSVSNNTRTDISAGIQVAMASFPPDTGKQIVILSDGNENLGNAVEQASLANDNNVRISVVPLQRDLARGEVSLRSVDAPSRVKQGAPFRVNVLAESLRDTDATITLYRDSTPLETRSVHLKAGKTPVVFEQSAPSSGIFQYRAVVNTAAGRDSVADNNIAYAYTRAAGKPRMLIVEGSTGDGSHLAAAMRANNMQVDLGGPERIPHSLAECAAYESIVFANVPAWRMAPVQMSIIRSAVRDTGMGFAMIGGEESFGAGGYYQTPIEEALPVTMDIKKQRVLPSLTLVIVIDISGSMSMTEDGVPKIRIAAEAACSAIDLMQEIDQVCVIGYDTGPVYTVKMQKIGDSGHRKWITQEVQRMEPGGGGIIVKDALPEAYKAVKEGDGQVKHVIMCMDASDTEEYGNSLDIARRMRNDKITVSVIGFGSKTDPDVPFHNQLAREGGGNAYLAERMSNLPAIFTRDVMYAAKSLLVEEPFNVRVGDTSHPAMRGVPWASSPPLLGYVATSLKDGPTVSALLGSPKEDPVFAAWPFGLGRSIAFTSDATAHWGAHWLKWPGYLPFWAQSLRWTVRQGAAPAFHTTIEENRGRAKIVVEAITAEGEYRNGLDLRAHLSHVAPGSFNGEKDVSEILPLQQTAPGRYEADFESRRVGTYLVTVEERGGEATKAMETVSMVIPYSPEFQSMEPNSDLLRQVAKQAGGKVAPSAEEIYTSLRIGAQALRDLWPLLFLLAAILLFADIAVRRVLLPWAELAAMAGAAVRRVIHARKPATAPAAPRQSTATMTTLLQRKTNTRQETETTTTASLRKLREEARAKPAPPPAPISAPAPEKIEGAPATTSVASTLLKKKRERKG